MLIPLVFLGEVAGHLCQCLRGRNANADRHSGGLPDIGRQVFAPAFQIKMLHALQVAEALVNRIAVERGRGFPYKRHHTICDITIELVVGREYGHLTMWEPLLQLIVRQSRLDAQCFRLITPGHHTSVIVGQHNNRFPVQVWTENTLARYVAVVAVNNGVHNQCLLISR